jgi:hypothetical protein
MTEQLKVATRREVIQAVVSRYQASSRPEKQQILNELTKVTGFHRKHALRVLKRWRTSKQDPPLAAKPRAGLYDEAVQQALRVVWEASDRLCGKRREASDPRAGRRDGAPRPSAAGGRSALPVIGGERGHHRSAP